MASPQKLPVSKLHTFLDPDTLPWKNSRDIPFQRLSARALKIFQPRVVEAMDLALGLSTKNCHIYLSGENGYGRSYLIKSILKPVAESRQASNDLVYVHNFSSPDSPILLSLPAGQAKKFNALIATLLTDISTDLKKRLAAKKFLNAYDKITQKMCESRSRILKKMSETARKQGFFLDFEEDSGFSLSPLNSQGKLLEDGKVVDSDRLDFRIRSNNLAKKLQLPIRDLHRSLESFSSDEKELHQLAMRETLDAIFTPVQTRILKICPSERVRKYLAELRADLEKNTEIFISSPEKDNESDYQDPKSRYAVNIFVDNSDVKGAPVIIEDNPSLSNLMGCIEREVEMGALVTDISLIRSGSLHRANGGFLVLHIEDLLRNQFAWDNLLRVLLTGKSGFERSDDSSDSAIRSRSLHPEPLEINLKIILIGNESFFENLLEKDERFEKLFGIKAHLREDIERSQTNIRFYLGQIARTANEAALLPFDAKALAWLVDLGSHLAEDQRKLSLRFSHLKDIMQEADVNAKLKKSPIITSEILEDAYAKKIWRDSLVEETFLEDYKRDMIKLPVTGRAIGQANGLTVTWTGNFEFGLPQRISCTVGVGHEGIIDLEREVEFGGPIHTKAIMILKSYLTDLFASRKPLVLSASLYFEQSYCDIDGDSASGAELIALLSAIANVPVRLDLAFTGAVSHSGQIIPVGGVSKKIEGFYKICSHRGLTGTQGVIIPHDNVSHLMLSPKILESVEKNEFSIYSVKSMEEAIWLLTGLKAGKRRKNGTFTSGSLYDLVDRRLELLGCYAQNAFRRSRG